MADGWLGVQGDVSAYGADLMSWKNHEEMLSRSVSRISSMNISGYPKFPQTCAQ